ncbi:MAG: hypothetical protein ABR910_04825 [Acidobacteriaceae bacterium]|jgi:hypothetical protein
MAIMIGRMVSVALVVAGLGLPVCAQRGGGGRGGGGFSGHGGGSAGHSGGFASSSAPAFHAGSISAGRVSFMGTPQISSSRYASATPNLRMPRPVGPPVMAGGGYGGRRGYPGGYRNGRPYVPGYRVGLGVGVPYGVGWLGPDCVMGFADCEPYDSAGYAQPAAPVDYGPGYDTQAPLPVEQAYEAPYPPVAEQPQAEPEPEDAVTLVFKDGRLTEQIHNYLLTRTTLYVQDGRRREIAVGDLDLAATAKANREAGVDFQLPTVAR